MADKLRGIKCDSQKIKNLRNTTIAHTDFNIHINLESFHSIVPNIYEIDSIIDDISELFNMFSVRFQRRPATAFNHVSLSHDGSEIINFLKKANSKQISQRDNFLL